MSEVPTVAAAYKAAIFNIEHMKNSIRYDGGVDAAATIYGILCVYIEFLTTANDFVAY